MIAQQRLQVLHHAACKLLKAILAQLDEIAPHSAVHRIRNGYQYLQLLRHHA
jgi:hypothetical protein